MSRRGLSIRAASPADSAGLSELLVACGHVITPGPLADRLAAILVGPGTALLAEDWGPPSGLVVVHWHATLRSAQHIARIDTLLISPEDRRRGLGRLLVKAAAQAARVAGCASLVLDVSPDLPELVWFCEATGFARAGETFVRSLRKGA